MEDVFFKIVAAKEKNATEFESAFAGTISNGVILKYKEKEKTYSHPYSIGFFAFTSEKSAKQLMLSSIFVRLAIEKDVFFVLVKGIGDRLTVSEYNGYNLLSSFIPEEVIACFEPEKSKWCSIKRMVRNV